jgi:hypothetical protein
LARPAVGEQHHQRRVARRGHGLRIGQRAAASMARRQRRAAAAGQPRQAALGAHQRARRRQQHLGVAAAEAEHRHLVAPHIAVGQQQLDRALGLGQPVHRRRARRIDDEDGRGLALLHGSA